MKKILIFMLMVASLACVAEAAMTNGQTFYRTNRRTLGSVNTNDPLLQFIGEVDGMFSGTGTTEITNLLFDDAITSDPTSTEGRMYYNSSSNVFRFYNGSSWVNFAAESGTVSLNVAYGNGSTITVDDGAVTLTAPNANDNIALAVVQADTGSTVAQTITSAGTGALLTFDSNGAGGDMLGSDSTWSMSKAGVFVFVGGATTGDVTITGSAADILFDVSDDELMFQDDAVLSFGDTADITFTFDGGDLDILGDGLEIAIGATGAGLDVFFWGQTGNYAQFDEDNDYLYMEDYSLRINEGGNLEFGYTDDAVDWTIDNASAETLVFLPTETTDDQTINFGDATNTTDFRLFGTNASTVVFDASGDKQTNVNYDILLDDASTLQIGTGADFSIYSDTANTLEFDPATAGNTIKFGTADTDAVDMIWYSDVSGDTVTFDEEAAQVVFEDVPINMMDDTQLQFGDGDDWYITSGTAKTLDMIPGATADSTAVLNIGADGAGADLILFGETASHTVWWDASGDEFFFGADDDGIDTSFYGDTASSIMKWTTATDSLNFTAAAVIGDGVTTITGMKQTVETYIAAGNTITIAESGTIYENTGDADGTLHTLPEASTAIGCVYTFVITETGQAIVVDLDNADVFLHLTLDAGDKITSSTLGDTITVMAVSDSQWAVISVYPLAADWADGGA